MANSKLTTVIGLVLALLSAVVGVFTQYHVGGNVVALVGAVLAAVGPALKAELPPPSAGVFLLVGILGLEATACSVFTIQSSPVVPVTPENSVQVSDCQQIATNHNVGVISGFVLGGISAGLGSVAAIDQNPNDRSGYAVGGVVAATLAAADTLYIALTASEFQNSNCAPLVGPLPVATSDDGGSDAASDDAAPDAGK